MNQYKRTLYITGVETTPHGQKLLYEIIRVDTSKDPNARHKTQMDENILKDKKYNIKEGDKIYFFPGCNIPRFKLKEFCNKYKVAPVKYEVRADVVIIGPESYVDLFETITRCRISFEVFNKWLSKIYPIADPRALQLHYDLKEVIENYEYIIFDYPVINSLTQNGTPFGIILDPPKNASSYIDGMRSNFIKVKDDKAYEYLQKILDPASNFYSQDDILKELNTGVVIDEDMYKTLRDLFISKDTENAKVAMTCLANSDYTESCMYILLLLKEFRDKIYAIKDKDHVNFKSMLKYFEISVTNGSIDMDDIILSLMRKKLLTTNLMEKLIPFIHEDLSSELNYSYLTIQKVGFTEDVINAMKQNDPKPVEISVEDIKNSTVIIDVDHTALGLSENNLNNL